MIEVKQAKTLQELAGCLAGNPVEHPDHYAGDGKIECMDAVCDLSLDIYDLASGLNVKCCVGITKFGKDK